MTFLKQTGGDLARRMLPVALALGVFIRPGEAVPLNLNPVQWTLTAEPSTVTPGTTIVLKLHALIDPEYHLYSLTTPKGGPIQTTISLAQSAGIERTAVYQPEPRRLHDPSLGVMVEVFTGSVDFLVPVKVKDGLADGPRAIALEVRYQACSDKICLPPAKREADTGIVIRAGAPVYKFNVPPGYRKVGQPTPSVASLGVEPSLDLHFIQGVAGVVPSQHTVTRSDQRFRPKVPRYRLRLPTVPTLDCIGPFRRYSGGGVGGPDVGNERFRPSGNNQVA